MKIYKTVLKSAAIAFVPFLLTGPSVAAENITVKAGQKTRIYQYATYEGSGCISSEYPVFKAKKTKNGELSHSRGSFIANNGVCKGKRLKSTDIYYTPKPGFRGVDRARVSLGTQRDIHNDWGLEYKSITFRITVE